MNKICPLNRVQKSAVLQERHIFILSARCGLHRVACPGLVTTGANGIALSIALIGP